jgi:iron-sulfur cluster assembly protein
MITITPEAARQIRLSAETTNSQGMHLRIAARREDDGTYVYGMGFDEMDDDDTLLAANGINVLVASALKDFFLGATLDFVELSPGESQFIFINPNDPAHVAASAPGDNPPA